MNEFDTISIDSVLEDAEYAIDTTLDYVQEADADIEASASTDVDVDVIDSIIGEDGKGSVALISDEDIEKIDKGEDPDFDGIDKDALKGEKDKEIKQLADDIKDNSIITKNEIKELKEGRDLLDFVGSIIVEDTEEELFDDDSDDKEEVVFKIKNDDDETSTISHTPKYNPEDDNEPAGPVQPLTDCKEQNNQYEFRFKNNDKEWGLEMFDDELLDESFEEDLEIEETVDESAEEQEEKYVFSLDEEAQFTCDEASECSDEKAENIIGEMDGLEDVDVFNSFEGSDINAKQFGEDDFLTGMNKSIDEPSSSFISQDSLKFSQVDTNPFYKTEDPSIADMIK
jgi:hypothetical protein